MIVAIAHELHGYRTVYCHLSALAVTAGETVRRGQRIGAVGTSGQRAWPGYEHVHWELQRDRDARNVEDPALRTVGCFDAARAYPSDTLTLTYPVNC
jgi:murein DD-endopeptidase MepM/ murein hydrolase activator NlpD